MTATFTDQELRLIPIEDLWQYVAVLKHDYIQDANSWTTHKQTERVDAKFATYQDALRVLKERTGKINNAPEVQERLDDIRKNFR